MTQHTLKVRIDNAIVEINCPPFANEELLDRWLSEYQASHPKSIIVSKSWRSPDAA